MSRARSAMTRVRRAALGTLFLVACAACGGDGDGDLPLPEAEVVARATGPLSATDYVLTPSPATALFTADPYDPEEDEEQTGEHNPTALFLRPGFADCMGRSEDTINPLPLDNAISTNFIGRTSQDGFVSYAGIYTPDVAKRLNTLAEDPDIPRCLKETDNADPSHTYAQIPAPEGALAAIRKTRPNQESTTDYIFLSNGRVFCFMFVSSGGGEKPNATLKAGLVDQLVDKLRYQ